MDIYSKFDLHVHSSASGKTKTGDQELVKNSTVNNSRQKFRKKFVKDVFTRFHMSLILSGTVCAGLIFSKLLLVFGLNHMVYRYMISLVLAYIFFFILMKIWLHYLTNPYRSSQENDNSKSALDIPDILPDSLSIPQKVGSSFGGHGGQFGGGGASGGWNVESNTLNTAPSQMPGKGSDLSIDLDLPDEGGMILIPLILLLLALLGGGLYLVYQAPVIISEAAFDFILAASLFNRARKMDHPNWAGSVFKFTVLPFLFSLVIFLTLSILFVRTCPEATKLPEVLKLCIFK